MHGMDRLAILNATERGQTEPRYPLCGHYGSAVNPLDSSHDGTLAHGRCVAAIEGIVAYMDQIHAHDARGASQPEIPDEPEPPCCDYRDHGSGVCPCPDHRLSELHPFGDP